MRHRRMSIGVTIAAVVLSLCATAANSQSAAQTMHFTPGSAGAGDPYFPLDGNGGYDVTHYDLDLSYNPSTERMVSTATIQATATQNLSRFNFDFDGLHIVALDVAGAPATWTRDSGELVVTPSHGILSGHTFTTVVSYHGRPKEFQDPGVGTVGFVHTNDGAVVVGEPHVASIWFPANDHPTDKASFSFHITVPSRLEAVSNGRLTSRSRHAGWTTWNWIATEPMASYLATMAIGHFDLHRYHANGIPFWDAVDPQLGDASIPAPRTGSRYAWSDQTDVAEQSYKRLSHRLAVPAAGGQLSFWVNRDTEPEYDFLTVEARPIRTNRWTTLRDLNGHTTHSLGFACPFNLVLHPFLKHYVTDNGDGTCASTGTTGRWWAASGQSDGYERWIVDLSRYAGKTVQLSISYVSDDYVQTLGVFVDDVVGPSGQGTTSFERDAHTMDGWSVPGAPRGDAPNPDDWSSTTSHIDVNTVEDYAKAALARQPEILRFESATFGAYPFNTSGAVVDVAPIGFALENQTRPTYSSDFFHGSPNDGVVVHELAHQWYGDSVALRRWSDVWLNEGFATYAEWLWSGHEGFDTPADIFNFLMTEVPADHELWSLEIGDPGPDHLFDFPVYVRGAMTLQALRMKIGDQAFFTVLRRWATLNAGGNGDTAGFRALAEDVSDKDLGGLFHTWLHTTTKPPMSPVAARSATGASARDFPHVLRSMLTRAPR